MDLLAEVRKRVHDGLSDEQWHEVVHLLVRQITIHTIALGFESYLLRRLAAENLGEHIVAGKVAGD